MAVGGASGAAAAAAAARAAAEARRRAEEARRRAEEARRAAEAAKKAAEAAKQRAAQQQQKIAEHAKQLQAAVKKAAEKAQPKKTNEAATAQKTLEAQHKKDVADAAKLEQHAKQLAETAKKATDEASVAQKAAEEAAKTQKLTEKAKDLGEDIAQKAITDAAKNLGKSLKNASVEEASKALGDALQKHASELTGGAQKIGELGLAGIGGEKLGQLGAAELAGKKIGELGAAGIGGGNLGQLGAAELAGKKIGELGAAGIGGKRLGELAAADLAGKKVGDLAVAELGGKRLGELSIAEAGGKKLGELGAAELAGKKIGELGAAEIGGRNLAQLGIAGLGGKKLGELGAAELGGKKIGELGLAGIGGEKLGQLGAAELAGKQVGELGAAEIGGARLGELGLAGIGGKKLGELAAADLAGKKVGDLAVAELGGKRLGELSIAEAGGKKLGELGAAELAGKKIGELGAAEIGGRSLAQLGIAGLGGKKLGELSASELGGKKIAELGLAGIGGEKLGQLGAAELAGKQIGQLGAAGIGGKKLGELAAADLAGKTAGDLAAAELGGKAIAGLASGDKLGEAFGHELSENFRDALGKSADAVLKSPALAAQIRNASQNIGRGLATDSLQAVADGLGGGNGAVTLDAQLKRSLSSSNLSATDIRDASDKLGGLGDPKKPEGLGRKEGQDYANATADRAEKQLGKPLSEASPAEADQAIKKAAAEEAKARNLSPEQVKSLEGKDSHDEKAKDFAKGYGDQVKQTLKERLGPNADVVLTGEGGRAVTHAVAGEVHRATEKAWGKDVADKAGEKATDTSRLNVSPAKQRELAQTRINDYKRVLDAESGAPRWIKDPLRAQVAHVLQTEVQNLPKSEQVKFLDQNRSLLSDISAGANGTPDEKYRKDIIRTLGETADTVGIQGAKVIGQEFAKNVTTEHNDVDDGDQLGGALKSVVNDGVGIGFASQVISSLKGNDKLSSARGDIIKATREGINDFRKDFEGAQKEYARVDGALNRYIAGFGSEMTSAQREKAIAAFKARPENQKIYDKYEKLQNAGGASLEGLDALNKDKSLGSDFHETTTKALASSPAFMQSPAGRQAVESGLKARAQDPKQPSFLDDVKGWANDLKTVKGYHDQAKSLLDGVSQSIVASVGNRVINDAAEGTKDTDELLKGLKNSSDILGLDQKQLNKGTEALQNILHAKTPEAREKALTDLKTVVKTDAPEKEASAGSKVLGALGVVFSAVNVGQTIKGGFDNKKLSQQIQAAGDALGLGAKAASWGLGALSTSVEGLKGAGAASKVFGAGAERLGALGAIASGVGAIEAFKEGNTREGAIGVANTVGSVLLEVPNPYAKLAGAVIIAGTAIADALLGGESPLEKQYRIQDEETAGLKTFLEAGGFPPKAAEAFSKTENGNAPNLGPFIHQVAPYFHKTPHELFAYLKQHPEKIADFQGVQYKLQSKSNGRTEKYLPVQHKSFNHPGSDDFGPYDTPDSEQYDIGKDGRVRNPGAGAETADYNQDEYASLIDGAADLKRSGSIPKDWNVYVPKNQLKNV